MAIDRGKFVLLDEIPEMCPAQSRWLKEQLGAAKGYYEPETKSYVIMINL